MLHVSSAAPVTQGRALIKLYAHGSHLDLSDAAYCCVLYGVIYIDLVSLGPVILQGRANQFDQWVTQYASPIRRSAPPLFFTWLASKIWI